MTESDSLPFAVPENPYLKKISDQQQQIKALVSKLCGAIDVLTTGMGGHNHWDYTMMHGAGCQVCIEQRRSKQEAARLRDEAMKLLEAKP